jgi:glycerate kinase
VPPTIVVAPDKFKGSCSAAEAGAAIVAGLIDVWGDRYTYDVVPMADGGEGTVDAFLASGATARILEVHGPLGAPVRARYAALGNLAVIEMAAASGLALVGDRLDPLQATTFGTGELILHALQHGAQRILLGIGGSATTDGGAGALAALGVRFADAQGRPLLPHPLALAHLAAIDPSGLDPRLAATTIDIACDVENPLVGPNGAAAVYGPQKGAQPADVARLDAVLTHVANVASALTGRDLRNLPGAGAAGGLGWGLATFSGARLARGFSIVADLRDLPARLQGAVLCVTAEGRIDAQTLQGKVIDGVAALCARTGVEVVALAGAVEPEAEAALAARGVACLPIVAAPMELAEAMREARGLIRSAAARFARLRRTPPAST